MPSTDIFQLFYGLEYLAAQTCSPLFPNPVGKLSLLSWRPLSNRPKWCCWEGEKCISAIILKAYSCQTHCNSRNTCWVAVAVGRARWRKTAVKVPGAVGSFTKTALCQLDVPNYLAAFQISGCPLYLPAHTPREYFSTNTTIAMLLLLFHFNFTLYVSVFLLFLVHYSAKESPVLHCRGQNKGWDLQLVGRKSITVKVFGN